MEDKELIFAYNDYQHCILGNNLSYAKGDCAGCKAHRTFCSYIWRLENEQWALHALADLANEPFEKIYCGYRSGYCAKCTDSTCLKIFDGSRDKSEFKARVCDEICAKALETI